MSCKYWCEYEWCSIKDMNCYGGEALLCHSGRYDCGKEQGGLE